MRLGLFAPRFDVLAGGVVLGLDLAQVVVGAVAFGGEAVGVIGMALAELLEAAAVVFERLGNLGNEVAAVLVVLGGARFESRELGGPSGEGCAVWQARWVS